MGIVRRWLDRESEFTNRHLTKTQQIILGLFISALIIAGGVAYFMWELNR